METFKFTQVAGDYALKFGDFMLYWYARNKSYSVTHSTVLGQVCSIQPYKGEEGTLGTPGKMFTVKADNYPGIGTLEQMVKQQDLLDYIDSIRMGRL